MIAASYCLAGADLPDDFGFLRPGLGELGLAARLELNNDSVAILRSGTDNPDAVAVCWGSGCNAIGRKAAGEMIRLPALGWISGDWVGGDDLAREAIRLVAHAHDGRGEPTMLQDLVLHAIDIPTVDEMIRTLQLKPKPAMENGQLPYLCHIPPLVFEAARAGDPVARGLVKRAGGEVATMAGALLRRLGLADRPADVCWAAAARRPGDRCCLRP